MNTDSLPTDRKVVGRAGIVAVNSAAHSFTIRATRLLLVTSCDNTERILARADRLNDAVG